MATKVKGLLKGLRNIFESEKEPELQIGFPTDVKHVAHIGWDGPSANAPSWMNEFNNTQLSLQPVNPTGEKKNPKSKLSSEGDSLLKNLKEMKSSARRHLSTSPLDSPTKKSSHPPKPSRRHRSSTSNHESPNTRQARRQQNSALGAESPSSDMPSETKQSRRRRSKGSSGSGSTKTSMSKGQTSSNDTLPIPDPEPSSGSGNGERNHDSNLSSVKEACEEKGSLNIKNKPLFCESIKL